MIQKTVSWPQGTVTNFAMHPILNASINALDLTSEANQTLQLTVKNVKGSDLFHAGPFVLISP